MGLERRIIGPKFTVIWRTFCLEVCYFIENIQVHLIHIFRAELFKHCFDKTLIISLNKSLRLTQSVDRPKLILVFIAFQFSKLILLEIGNKFALILSQNYLRDERGDSEELKEFREVSLLVKLILCCLMTL